MVRRDGVPEVTGEMFIVEGVKGTDSTTRGDQVAALLTKLGGGVVSHWQQFRGRDGWAEWRMKTRRSYAVG